MSDNPRPQHWNFENAAEMLSGRVAEAMEARGIKMKAFPARRGDEKGWCIGHQLDGITLVEQLTMTVPMDEMDCPDDHINGFIKRLAGLKPTISALMSRPDMRTWRDERHGLYMRFIPWPNSESVRMDVIIGSEAPDER